MEIQVITTQAQWQALEKDWDALLVQSFQSVPFLSFGYLRAWWDSMGGGEWLKKKSSLAILCGYENGTLAGIAPLFLSKKPGHPLALRFIGQIEVSDYLDLICRESDLPAFCEAMLAFLEQDKQLPTHQLSLANLLNTSPTPTALAKAAEAAGWEYVQEVIQPSPYIPLAENFDTYLASIDKKQRHEIRRKLRNADLNYEVDWYSVEHIQSCQAEMDDFLAMMRNESQKDAFLTQEMVVFMQQATLAMCKQDKLVLSFLTLNGEKAGAYLSFLHEPALLVYNSAFNPRFSSASPGWVLLAKLIQWAITEGLTELDMMRGDEDYKYKFGGVNRYVSRIELVPPKGI